MVSTYLLLIMITLFLVNFFISQDVKSHYLEEKKMNLLTQANIIGGRVLAYGDMMGMDREENVDDLIKKYSKEIKGRVLITNEEGKVLSDAFDELEGITLEQSELKEALEGKSVTKQYTLEEYGKTMYVAVPIILERKIYGAVFISASLKDIYSNINQLRRNYILLSLLCIGITGFISFVFAYIIAKPIERLTMGIKKMYHGNLQQRVEITGNDELSNLGMAFNMMSTKLAQVDGQRKEFVGNVSHELKTPLSAIKILSESLLYQENHQPEIYKEFLKDIDSEVDRLNTIIESLLSLVDLDQDKLDLNLQITYVNYLIEQVVQSLKPLAEQKNITMDFISIEKIQIKLDQLKIQQALTNIIYNGIKYTPEEGKIEISLYSEGEEVLIKIKDSGIGIPKESIPHIFERFYRVDKARARATGGTGLGLSISEQIITLHQGKIQVTSEMGKGATFIVKVPRKIDIHYS